MAIEITWSEGLPSLLRDFPGRWTLLSKAVDIRWSKGLTCLHCHFPVAMGTTFKLQGKQCLCALSYLCLVFITTRKITDSTRFPFLESLLGSIKLWGPSWLFCVLSHQAKDQEDVLSTAILHGSSPRESLASLTQLNRPKPVKRQMTLELKCTCQTPG